ncbi:MAG: hypothetical protein ACRD29_05335 [Acidimicrobiales bacterium]
MPTDRDLELGRALAFVDPAEHLEGLLDEVPPAPADFYDELARRLGEPQPSAPTPGPPFGPRPRPRHAHRARRGRRHRAHIGALLYGALAVVALVALGLALVVFPGGRETAEPPTTEDAPTTPTADLTGTALVAHVRQEVESALSGTTSVQATMRWEFADVPDADPVRVLLADDGSFRWDDAVGVRMFNAETGELLSIIETAGGAQLSRQVGLTAVSPDAPGHVIGFPLHYSSALNVLRVEGDPRIEDATWDGRPAWRIADDASAGQLITGRNQLDTLVDQETGVTVELTVTPEGADAFSYRVVLTDLAVNVPADPAQFTLSAAEIDEADLVHEHDSGYVRVGSPDEAADVVGYEPLVPAAVPDGFELTDIWAAPEPDLEVGVQGVNPAFADVIVATYRRGMLAFTISTRATGGEPAAWQTPFALTNATDLAFEDVSLDAGALTGQTGHVFADVPPDTNLPVLPHLWTAGPDLVTMVAGDLTAAQLVTVAESLQPAA